jgi:hypothetical protein
MSLSVHDNAICMPDQGGFQPDPFHPRKKEKKGTEKGDRKKGAEKGKKGTHD